MRKLKQLTIITAMFALAMPAVILAATPPMSLMPPIIVYGTVTIDGNVALSGTVSVVGVSANIESDGQYSIKVPFENNGKELTFKVNGITADGNPKTVNTPSSEINLSITTPEDSDPVPDPTPPSGGSGPSGGGGDTTPPTNTSIIINSDEETTVSAEVVLTISANGASQMMIADNINFTGAGWENYAVEKNWVLAGENGEKTVYAKFKDTAGNISSPVQDTIILSIPDDEKNKPAADSEQKDEVIVAGVEADYRTIQLNKIINEAGYVWGGDANVVSANMGINRDPEAEVSGYNKYTSALISGMDGLEQSNIYAITNFIVYGTPTTKILGAGERAGVLNSYKSAFGKLPKTESEWQDAIKIANGRWPSQRSEAAEAKAKQEFKKVYLREPDMDNPNDNAAVTVIAYGLRPDSRNLDSEKAGILTFKHIYGYSPVSATDWDIVRAIAYSGAVR